MLTTVDCVRVQQVKVKLNKESVRSFLPSSNK